MRKSIFAGVMLLLSSIVAIGLNAKRGEAGPETFAGAQPVAAFVEGKPADAPKPEALTGDWIFESASRSDSSMLRMIWSSKVTVSGESFVVSKFLDLAKPLKGSFTIDPSAEPKKIDLKLEEYDLAETGMAAKISKCTLQGIFKQDGDRLTIRFNMSASGKRPAGFDGAMERTVGQVTLKKCTPGFKGFPKEFSLRVLDPAGKPVADAVVAGFMSLREDGHDKNAKSDWQYYESFKTDANGTLKLPFDNPPSQELLVRHREKKLMALVGISPVSLLNGEVVVKLAAEREISGTIVCDELQKAGKPIDWTNVYVWHNGERVADCISSQGRFEFVLPPGSYVLDAYGTDLKRKHVPIAVTEGVKKLEVDPIHLTASQLILLQGQPAPEPAGIVGWKGKPVRLADLKGKYVMLEFWGYWCGPCVQSMPILIELHEKFADKGLVIIGIHRDVDGDIDTAAKLDEKISPYKKHLWSGKDLPFPNALVSGNPLVEGDDKTRADAIKQYGIDGYPTTVLIDREGKVVGRFNARDVKMAIAEVEKLLNAKK
jgi:uncharacterized protein (TIGR03067 family)